MCKKTSQLSPYLMSVTKRLFDIILSLVLLVPVLFLIAILSVLVFFVDGLPIFFIQKRVGKDGEIFNLIKIRTLDKDTDPYISGCQLDIRSCVTKTGVFLRKHRLDELPQLFLILTGKMSFIGPRPEIANIAARYSDKAQKRLFAKPGLSGLWQVYADRNRLIQEDIKYDFYYLRKASLLLDIKISIRTIYFVLFPDSYRTTDSHRTFSLSEIEIGSQGAPEMD